MCGIVGFVNLDGNVVEDVDNILKNMTKELIHRGPDEEGYYTDQYTALGHRRLKIIDLSTGRQPIVEYNLAVIVFNGEIYNFKQIKKTLISRGHKFNTNSDTEVILKSYLEWGVGCLKEFIGMFAFAIWDIKNKKLFLARDRIGKKPLYYMVKEKTIIFSSEIKSILKYGEISKELDYESLDCYFSFGYIPSPKTIFKDIRKLEPGNYVIFSHNGFFKRRYWNIEFNPDTHLTLEDGVEKFLDIFKDAVKKRLTSDVPLGAFLSGGIDSSLVVSMMNEISGDKILTNSIGFDHEKYNELPAARDISNHIGTIHKEYVVKSNIHDLLPRLIYHLDEPLADSSAVPTYYVCKMARENCTVALTGDGGDETFGGYTFRYIPHMFESRIRSIIPTPIRALLFYPLGELYPRWQKLPRYLRLKTFLQNLGTSDEMAFYQDLIWLPGDVRKKIYSKEFQKTLLGFTPFEFIFPLYKRVKHLDPVSRAQFCDLNFYLPEDVLVKVDRMSMANSLEVRSPLLDHRIIEFGTKLPLELKVSDKKGKILLRRALSRFLPDKIMDRPKQGFSIPEADWLRKELRDVVEESIENKNSIVQDIFDMKRIRNLWDRHVQKKENHSVFFWGLMIFSLWEERFYRS